LRRRSVHNLLRQNAKLPTALNAAALCNGVGMAAICAKKAAVRVAMMAPGGPWLPVLSGRVPFTMEIPPVLRETLRRTIVEISNGHDRLRQVR
jgi:hypothetical protein